MSFLRLLRKPKLEEKTVEAIEAERSRENLKDYNQKAAIVIAKGNVTLTKSRMAESVIREHLDHVSERLDMAANVGNQRKYVLLYPRSERLRQQLAAVQDIAEHTEEMIVETEVAGMMQEALLDSTDVQERYLETLTVFLEITEMNPGLIEKFQKNMSEIALKRKNADKSVKIMRTIATAFRDRERSVPPEAVKAFKEHRKKFGLPP